VRHLVENEWAQGADDVLWRRSKLGIIATPEQHAALGQFIASL
jgi:glycerol-3-phosphate dehydrogenase